ncbi:acyl-ACP thioesterase [Odoribacter sp. OttesenSCG-928-J03]|nr:acyl-ACP thioesterase [Odoribacter sp. OttesenSCG-928-J03]MDL2283404.1 acyl-ACP thioesterase [Odoribacter sp. OttesenSCG-928-G04]
MIAKYTEKVRIYNHYVDYNGRLALKTLCDLMNDVAEGQTTLLGVDVDTLNLSNQTWMLHRLHIVINELPVNNEEVVIETWPSGIDRLFALRDYRMLREDGEVLVNATSEWMLIDLERRRPIRQTARIVELSTTHSLEKLPINSILDEKSVNREMTEARHFTATFDNIDFNGHVTLTSYMRWIVNSLPFEFLKGHQLQEVEIVYQHEILPESNIISYYERLTSEGRTEINHMIKDDQNKQEHCVARTIWKK